MFFTPRPTFEWRLRNRSLTLGPRTLVMAIINVTPDSFSGDGLSLRGEQACINAAVEAHDRGADIIDLGAESTRPGAEPLKASTEQRRLLPVLEGLLSARPDAIASVDTYHALTALEAAHSGAQIINDVSGLLWDAQMAEAIRSTHCGLVLMHTRGRSKEWATQPRLAHAQVLPTVSTGLREQLAFAQAAGVDTRSIVLDPGFGFGKLGTENITLLAGLTSLNTLGRPLLAGLSRKGFLGDLARSVQPQNLPIPTARFTPTVAANTAAILAGAHILRVHDVQPAREAAAIADALLSS